jgi:putative tricarboxylic transport membrane protein
MLKNTQRIMGSVFCIGLGVWATVGGLNLQLLVMGVPASGLFPFMFGAILVAIGAVSLLIDVQHYRAGNSSELSSSDYTGKRKVFAYFILSISCALLIPIFGFVIPSFILLLILFALVEGVDWKRSLLVASGFVIFCDVLFIRALGVQLQSFNF